MKQNLSILFGAILLLSCEQNENKTAESPLKGTWQLISGTLIDKGDTAVTDYTHGIQMIKIINDSHFAFLNHDLNKGKDSTAAQFVAGGGRYELTGDNYTEHLEYCSDRQWEGNDFVFTVQIKDDTLTQSGIEKVAGTTIDRVNIEKYVRLK
ncbi:MAG TPA: hypothetical protein VIU13_17755 [Chryseolinea sp.]